ncbi:hypothetical protein DM02DRAFT_714643 [Periconia macrospinosa]|uniref:Tetraspanin Tsp3 n=1 Tax=Periconia macrospinosa TaxID=97972 RepID=A0A2V1E9E4_9PLEO|nr:hypothetical protein DM02DRAFT_714643 [Periconia macrospinosa]
MAYTRKQVVTCISIVFLLFATALAGYASSEAERFSIPISNGLAYATTLLPLVSGLLLECGYDFTRFQERRKRLDRGKITRPPLVIVANTLIFIYSTVVITLLGTHAAPPAGHDCALRDQWTTLYRKKNGEGIRTIQQAFQCCGFQHSRDMAWPFPDKTHKPTACEEAFGHTNGCFEPWKGEEQRIAGVLMAVVGLVFVWQFAIIVVPTKRESWLHRVVPDGVSRLIAGDHGNVNDEEGGGSRAVAGLLPQSAYLDRVQEEISDDDEGGERSGVRRAIERRVQGVGNAFAAGDRGDEEREDAVPEENAWLRS